MRITIWGILNRSIQQAIFLCCHCVALLKSTLSVNPVTKGPCYYLPKWLPFSPPYGNCSSDGTLTPGGVNNFWTFYECLFEALDLSILWSRVGHCETLMMFLPAQWVFICSPCTQEKRLLKLYGVFVFPFLVAIKLQNLIFSITESILVFVFTSSCFTVGQRRALLFKSNKTEIKKEC